MRLRYRGAEIFVPDGLDPEQALARTTHLAVGAHPDDLEITAFHGILACFGRADRWLAGVVATDGAGSPRDDLYRDYTDQEMQVVRRQEQRKAAVMGEYGVLALLNYPSAVAKDPAAKDLQEDLGDLLRAARPQVVYIHNLADKHDTHVACALRTLQALRALPPEAQPEAVWGCEVWRDLDWMADQDKVALDVGAHENLAAGLLGIFDSQVCGGKRYDLATLGRRRAHATYHATHGTDATTGLTFAMDLTPLMRDPALGTDEYVREHIARFQAEISDRLRRMGG